MTFGDLIRNWRFCGATALAVALGVAVALGAGLLGGNFDESTLVFAVPFVSILLLLPLATVVELRWSVWPTAVLVLAIHVGAWLLLTAGFFGWTDARWLDGQGFSAGSPGGLSLAFAIVCCVAAIPLGISTLLAPALTFAAGLEQPLAVARRLLALPVRTAGGVLLMLVTAIGGSAVAAYAAFVIAYMGGGPVGLVAVLLIALAGSVSVAAVTAMNVVWLADMQAPARPARVRVVLACGALIAAGLGLVAGERLDYTDVSRPLTLVERDAMTKFMPSGGQLQNEIRSKRGRHGAPQIDRSGTMYERNPMVMRSFLLSGDARAAADEAAAAATAAGWRIQDKHDPYSSTVSYSGTRTQDGTDLELSISATGRLQCPPVDDNPFCHRSELRVEVRSEWERDPETRELAKEPMAAYVPPGTTAARSQEYYGPTSISRQFYVLKPAGRQKVLDAATAAAEAAQSNGWRQSVTGEHLWVGEKRDGDQLLRLRIDTDLLKGASGSYIDDKEGFVKILIAKVDR